jgi:hypothetical protein
MEIRFSTEDFLTESDQTTATEVVCGWGLNHFGNEVTNKQQKSYGHMEVS